MKATALALIAFAALTPATRAQEACKVRVDLHFYKHPDSAIDHSSVSGYALQKVEPDPAKQESLVEAVMEGVGQTEWNHVAKKKYAYICLADANHPGDYFVFWTQIAGFSRALLFERRASGCAVLPPWAGDVESGKDAVEHVFKKMMEFIAGRRANPLPDTPNGTCLASAEVDDTLRKITEADWERAYAEKGDDKKPATR
jgi:hypothetical protein